MQSQECTTQRLTPVHVNRDELHQLCYEKLWPHWNTWLYSYHLPLERTTLQVCTSKRVYIAIAGRAFSGPVKNRDAIWMFVNRPRPKSSEPTIELALVVDPDDYNCAEAHQERQIEEVELSKEVWVSRASYVTF